ncbi:MAG: 2,3-diaminopropionate biosynthesis protein SbnB [Acidobacteriota bacterium]
MSTDDLLIVGAREVASILEGRENAVLDAVQRAYENHTRGDSSLPHSSFLRFPDSDLDRIISLPAYLGGDGFGVAGLKWIASVPANVERGIERASAVVILNRRETGRPYAILEGSLISKQRTAASAALAARVLRHGDKPRSVGFVGCGPINLEVGHFLTAVWPDLDNFLVFDLSRERAEQFRDRFLASHPGRRFEVAGSLDETFAGSGLVTFATTSGVPYVETLDACQPGTTILHVSLRDLAPEILLQHHNIVDDLGHVCRANTSIHLTAEKVGHRDFVHGSIGELLLGEVEIPDGTGERLNIFSPFGLGVLDLAVAEQVYAEAKRAGLGSSVEAFLP